MSSGRPLAINVRCVNKKDDHYGNDEKKEIKMIKWRNVGKDFDNTKQNKHLDNNKK